MREGCKRGVCERGGCERGVRGGVRGVREGCKL